MVQQNMQLLGSLYTVQSCCPVLQHALQCYDLRCTRMFFQAPFVVQQLKLLSEVAVIS